MIFLLITILGAFSRGAEPWLSAGAGRVGRARMAQSGAQRRLPVAHRIAMPAPPSCAAGN
jgi:hypothetical protein